MLNMGTQFMNTRVKKNILMPIMRMVNDGKQNKTARDLHCANDNKNGVRRKH